MGLAYDPHAGRNDAKVAIQQVAMLATTLLDNQDAGVASSLLEGERRRLHEAAEGMYQKVVAELLKADDTPEAIMDDLYPWAGPRVSDDKSISGRGQREVHTMLRSAQSEAKARRKDLYAMKLRIKQKEREVEREMREAAEREG